MESNKYDGGPAFPAKDWQVKGNHHPGMSLRNYIAIRAMQGDWAAQSESTGEWANSTSEEYLLNRARLYYRMADAMIKVSKE